MWLHPLLARIFLPPFQRKLTVIDGLENLPRNSGGILAPNHSDWLDGFYLSAAVYEAQKKKVKFLTVTNNYWWTGVATQIPYQKDKIVDRAIKDLRYGGLVCNFPEGRRNPSAQLSPGRTGTVRMAVQADIPVIPVGIRCLAGQTMRDSLRILRSRENPVAIYFGPPLTFTAPESGVTHEWLTAETGRLMAAIAPLAGKTV